MAKTFQKSKITHWLLVCIFFLGFLLLTVLCLPRILPYEVSYYCIYKGMDETTLIGTLGTPVQKIKMIESNRHLGIAKFKKNKDLTVDCFLWEKTINGSRKHFYVECYENKVVRISEFYVDGQRKTWDWSIGN